MKEHSKIPATIITGFLGSGKTTLLNNIIKNESDINFAIIENEFGEINIDKDLIIGVEDNIYDLKNGCVCCTLNDEFANTILELFSSGRKFDHLIVETTGIADPNMVAASFYEKIIRDNLYFNGTVCVVDASAFNEKFYRENIMLRQISFADVILMNKSDLAAQEDIKNAVAESKKLNSESRIITSINCNTDTKKILDINAYTNKIIHKATDHIHQDSYSSYAFSFDEEFDPDLFKYAITSLNTIFGNEMLRIKGIIYFVGSNEKHIFQSIKDFGDIYPTEKGIGEKRESKIVFIGRNLKKESILKELNSALAERI